MKKGTVEKITNGGWGLVRSDEGVVFLNDVLPGEQITFHIKEKARGILWGQLEEVLTPSEHRIEPPCPYYGQCGGCVFQHINYQYQQKIKQDILLDDLKRIGNYEEAGDQYHYIESPPFHNRIRARMKAQVQEGGKIGFIRKGTKSSDSHQPVPPVSRSDQPIPGKMECIGKSPIFFSNGYFNEPG